MPYTNQYVQLFRKEKRIPYSKLKIGNVYRISTYAGGDPKTKTGKDARYVFSVGKIDNKLHCIKLNEIKPSDFVSFLNTIRDKRKSINVGSNINDLLYKFSNSGKELFDKYVKPNGKIYKTKPSNYRTYISDKITYVNEVQFEYGLLQEIFGEINDPKTIQERNVEIKEEINERDG